MKPLLGLFAVIIVLIGFAYLSALKHTAPVAAGPAPDVRHMLLAGIRPGMSADSVDLLIGMPALIVEGIPELREEKHDGLPARVVEGRDRDRFESWYFRSVRIDTLRTRSKAVLFDPENNEYPQLHRKAYLELSLTLVIDKATNRVARVDYLPRGFLDRDGDIEDGAVIG